MKKKINLFDKAIFSAISISTIFSGIFYARLLNIENKIFEIEKPEEKYITEKMNFFREINGFDFNQNEIEDYIDILNGAKLDAINKPFYNNVYWESGYPPDNIGVCTDVIWRAFKNAGYSLRDMVHNDIVENSSLYPLKNNKADYNIDFRRVEHLKVYFDRYAISLTIDPFKYDQWMPGDIVIYENDAHIGIVSDTINKDGIPYLIHNSGQEQREEDVLISREITSHYRFDATLVDKNKLIRYE